MFPDVHANRACNLGVRAPLNVADPNCDYAGRTDPGEIVEAASRDHCIFYAQSKCVTIARTWNRDIRNCDAVGRRYRRDDDGRCRR